MCWGEGLEVTIEERGERGKVLLKKFSGRLTSIKHYIFHIVPGAGNEG